jgi:hypothetical protein
MKKTIFVLLLTIILQNCIGTRYYNVSEVSSNDIQFLSNQQIKIFAQWNFNSSLSFSSQEKMAMEHQKLLMKTIEETVCCVVVQNPDEANLILRGTFTDVSNVNAKWLSLATHFSLFLIPSWRDIKINITATVQNYEEEQVYNISDSMRKSQWLPLIFLMPFSTSVAAQENDMNQNLYRSLFLQIARDGFFQ